MSWIIQYRKSKRSSSMFTRETIQQQNLQSIDFAALTVVRT